MCLHYFNIHIAELPAKIKLRPISPVKFIHPIFRVIWLIRYHVVKMLGLQRTNTKKPWKRCKKTKKINKTKQGTINKVTLNDHYQSWVARLIAANRTNKNVSIKVSRRLLVPKKNRNIIIRVSEYLPAHNMTNKILKRTAANSTNTPRSRSRASLGPLALWEKKRLRLL